MNEEQCDNILEDLAPSSWPSFCSAKRDLSGVIVIVSWSERYDVSAKGDASVTECDDASKSLVTAAVLCDGTGIAGSTHPRMTLGLVASWRYVGRTTR